VPAGSQRRRFARGGSSVGGAVDAITAREEPASTAVALTPAPRPDTNSACGNRTGVRHQLRGADPLRAMT
jgi:hypothetical protein